MGTLNLTTADNYLTVIVNGTTIKQLWAKQGNDGTPVKVYQKWKTTHVAQYTNTIGNTYRCECRGVNYKYQSALFRSSYCIYRLQMLFSVLASRSPTGRARVAGYFNGRLISASDYWYGGYPQSFDDDCETIYAISDDNYDTKSYPCYGVLFTSNGSNTDAGYGSDGQSTTSTVYTPSHIASSTGAINGPSAYVNRDSYQGVDTSYDYREEDN